MKFPYTIIHPKTGERVHPAKLIAEAAKAGEIRTRGNIVDLLLDNLDYHGLGGVAAAAAATVRQWVERHACLFVNARFWVWGPGNSPVKLTLAPDCSLHHTHSWDNGEGYSYETRSWTHEGAYVSRVVNSGGTDCDGRHSHHQKNTCLISNLDRVKIGREIAGAPDGWPLWRVERASQRDYAAEAMGY